MSSAESKPPQSATPSTDLIVYDQQLMISSINDKDSTTTTAATLLGGVATGKYLGLLNQGATCYMNSLLQALYMTPEFRISIYKWVYNPEKDGNPDMCIPLQLQKLFGLLQLSKQNAISTVALTRSFGWDSNEVFQQQDVQELCRKLFEALEDAFKDTNEVVHVIDELFSGELIDYIKCIDIDHESEKRDKFLDFSLAIKPFDSEVIMHSLSECIESYLQPELLDGDNMVYVESIEKKVPAIKGLKIGKLPHVMSIHLKRFVFDFTGPNIVQKKLNDQVRFPMILDMNKYVAGRRKFRDGSLDGGALQRLDSVEGNEFESFLKEQIKKLRSHSGQPPPPPPQPDMTDPTVPDLVDYNGNLSPDQIAENAIVYPEEVEVTQEMLAQLLVTKGEWIYELYAVLIHSGASSGGHYYAYIKDLDEESWWNFNDATVTKIEPSKVLDAWGGKNTSTASAAAGSSASYTNYQKNRYAWSSNSLSMSNAYMLYYRKISINGKRVGFPTKEEIPLHVQALVEEHEREEQVRQQEEEERRNSLRVKIQWKSIEISPLVKRNMTYKELLLQLWREYNIAEDFPDDAVFPLEVIRLRKYNSYTKVPLQSYDVNTMGDTKLSHLPLNEYTTYYLECRKANEVFEEYDEGGISVTVVGYNSVLDSLDEPRSVRLKQKATIADLISNIAGWTTIPEERVRVVKFINSYEKQTPEVISRDVSKRIKEDLRLFEGQKLYYEEESELAVEEGSLYRAYMVALNTVTLKLNCPPSQEMNRSISIDRRLFASDLRQQIGAELNKPPETIYLYKNLNRAVEIKNSSTESLHHMGVQHSVFVDLYPAPSPGAHRLQVFQCTPTPGYKPGFVPLDRPCSDLVNTEMVVTELPTEETTPNVSSNASETDLCDTPTTTTTTATVATVLPQRAVVNVYDSVPASSPISAPPAIATALADVMVSTSPLHGADNFDVGDYDIFQTAGEAYSSSSYPSNEFGSIKMGANIATSGDDSLNAWEILDTLGACIRSETLVFEVKDVLLRLFIRSGTLPEHATTGRLRLWEKMGSSKGRLLKYDHKSLLDNCFAVSDWRHLFVQILNDTSSDSSGELTLDGKESDVLMLVQRWHRHSWTMGAAVDISISQDMTVASFFDALSCVSNIPTENLRLIVLFPFTELALCGLHDDKYLASKNMKWMQKPVLNADQRLFDWYSVLTQGSMNPECADGTLLVIQDCSEPLRYLRPEEKSSQLKVVENDHSYFNASMFNTNNYGTATSSVLRPQKVERGIRIKSRSEKDNGELSPSPGPEQVKNDSHVVEANNSSNFDIL